MSDDWRVQVAGAGKSGAQRLAKDLRGGAVEHRLETAAGDRVVVSLDDEVLFLYAGTREQAQAASEAVDTLARTSGLTVTTTLRHWHPVAEQWEDPEAPLPDDGAGVSAELSALAESEDKQSALLGVAEYEVRVQLPTHQETLEFAQQLQALGLTYVRRWHHVLIGAGDQAAAERLAHQLGQKAPADSKITVEGSAAVAEAGMPQNPFVVFGGLGV